MAASAEAQTLGPPRSSPFAALAWKQVRESAPLGLMGAVLVVVALAWSRMAYRDLPGGPEEGRTMALATWATIGFFVAIVAGVGAFMDDLRPGLFWFWRSRPIGVDQWFAVKFIGGLLTTIPLMLVPLVVFLALKSSALGVAAQDETWRAVANSVTFQVVVYCAAAAMMTLVRQPIYAAVLAIGVVMFSLAMVALVYPRWNPNQQQGTTLVIAGVFGIVAAEIARRAVTRNWGWKG